MLSCILTLYSVLPLQIFENDIIVSSDARIVPKFPLIPLKNENNVFAPRVECGFGGNQRNICVVFKFFRSILLWRVTPF